MPKSRYTTAFFTVTSLFFMWGFITVLVDSLIPRLREIFELSYFEAGLVQFAFFIAYGLLSLPAGYILSKIGYKKGMVLGLATMGVGCLLFWPAAGFRIFEIFLLGYFTLAGGMTILQVAANPYVSVLGPEETASSRLNLSQAFNSLGTTIAPIIGAAFLLSDNIRNSVEIELMMDSERSAYLIQEASAVQAPFIWLAVSIFFLASIVHFSRLPQILNHSTEGSYLEVIRNRKLLFGAIGIFIYVGSEVAIGSYLVNYFLDMKMDVQIAQNPFLSNLAGRLLGSDITNVDAKGIVGAFVAFYWGGAMLGRFIGSYLTKVFRANIILSIFSLLAITMILISQNSMGFVSMLSILLVGLFNSIMFPTIFTLSIEDLGSLKPRASGILCTAIVGGAFIPPLFGKLADLYGFKPALILLIVCYSYILLLAWKVLTKTARHED